MMNLRNVQTAFWFASLLAFFALPGRGQIATESALSFNGTNGYVQAPSAVWFNGNFTVEAWVYVRSYNSWSRLIDFANGPGSDNVYVALTFGNVGTPTMGVFTNNNGTPILQSPVQLPTNQWAHLAATLNGTTGTIYINGNVAVTGTLNVAPDVIRTNNYIGRSNYAADSYANADFEEIRIWNVARTQAQIQSTMYQRMVGTESGLVGYWRCDDGSGTTLTNRSAIGSLYNGTLLGGVTWTNFTAPIAVPYALGATNLFEGPVAGTDSVVLAVSPSTEPWNAIANATWLHLITSDGTGSTNVVFTFDTNPGVTRSGTITIASQTLTVTQAGNTYVAVPTQAITLVASGLDLPGGVAVDGAGNLYITDTEHSALKEWTVADTTVNTLIPSGLGEPYGVAVDGAGNVYVANYDYSLIEEWTAANQTVSTLVSSGFTSPIGLAVDGGGNVYIGGYAGNDIKEWMANSHTLATLVSTGLDFPSGVALDAAGNLYIADSFDSQIKELTAANLTVTPLVSSGLNLPYGVAVDGSGNVYIADSYDNAIKRLTAANNTVTTLISSGLNTPNGVAVDGTGNIYVADTDNNAIKELPRAFVDPTARVESVAAGNDALPVVLPATENLTGPLAPTSDQPWLSINGVVNGIVNFSFTANAGASRTANLTVLGQSIPITQEAAQFSLGTTNLLEGAETGTDSVLVAVNLATASWTAAANATWLHLGTSAGIGPTNEVFTFDDNPGATRGGTITIAGQTLTVTQAGNTYVAAPSLPIYYSSLGLSLPCGVAVDGTGNVYIADSDNNAIKEWVAASNTVITLVSSGLNFPSGVAVDGAGNVYFTDSNNGAVKEWLAVSNSVIALVPSGLSDPFGVAVDRAGNVYIADYGQGLIMEWTAGNKTLTTLVSGVESPGGVAVDISGNVYFTSTYYGSMVEELNRANGMVTTLASAGLNDPFGLAVDGSGNVYIADTFNATVKKWTAADQTVTTLDSVDLNYINGVAVDGTGNIYIADTDNQVIQELPHAFVDPTTRTEGPASGSDALPGVLPATENLTGPLAPTSDQLWLSINGVANGIISFSFTANTGASRTATLNVLGQSISVTQSAEVTVPVIGNPLSLGNGGFQFTFTNSPGATFTVHSSTNLSLPLADWPVVGTATNVSGDIFQFSTQSPAVDSQRFYRVSSP